MFEEISRKLYEIGIVPVVVINDAERAAPLARALYKGGIPTAEITFRTPAAAEAIRRIAKEVPELLVGAGTVTSIAMAKTAVAAGAKYLVSPGFNPKVVGWCAENKIPIFPGISTPTELEAAMEIGLTTVKFFPAEQSGGRAMLSALSSPYGGVKFIPTGGIGQSNLKDYLDLPNVLACGGSWICPPAMIDEGRFDGIEALCAQAVLKMHNFSLLHVGLNCANADEASSTADIFSDMFRLQKQDLPGAFFAGTLMEVIKKPFLGEHGHIAVSTDNIDRAIAYFEGRGYRFREEGVAKDEKGIIAVYFAQEVGGFAVHLRRKL